MTKHNERYALTLQIFRFILLFIAAIVIGVSCSTKKATTGIGGPGGIPSYSGGDPTGQMSSIVQQMCPAGALPPLFFSTGVNTTPTTLNGPFNQGSIYAQGAVGNVYVGGSAFGDIMIVRQIYNGSAVVGYDIELDMCPFPPLVVYGRPITGFQSQGITITKNNNCVIGDVSYAMTVMQAGDYQGTYPGTGTQYPGGQYQNVGPAPIETVFAPIYNKPGCQQGGGYYGY
jgi:hypothetical protein